MLQRYYLSNRDPNTGIPPAGPWDTQYGSLITTTSAFDSPILTDGWTLNTTEIPFGATIPDGSYCDIHHYGNADVRTVNQPTAGFPDNGGRTTILPTNDLPIGKWAWRTPSKLLQVFNRGIWALHLRTNIGMSNLDTLDEATFSITARIFKGFSADGSDAIEITNQLLTSTPVTVAGAGVAVNAAYQDFLITNSTAIQRVEFKNEYLFINFAVKIGHLNLTNVTHGGPSIYPVRGPHSYIETPNVGANVNEDVCRPFGQPEMYLYITTDGTQYPLSVDGSRVVLNDQGTGIPPLEYVTQRGPQQQGETLLEVFAKPRIVQLMILQRYNNRDSYWNGRANLLRTLSPRNQLASNLLEQGTLRRILSTGDKRDLKCLIQEGPNFQPRRDDAWDELSYTEALRFIAFDPIYFDPTLRAYVFNRQGSQLVFPVIFPIQFTNIDQTATLYYNGSWKTYPTFIITGPCNFVMIENQTTDEVLELICDLAAGQTATIALDYANKTVTRNDGLNLMPYISYNSDIGTFHLTEAGNGINTLRVYAQGVTAASQIDMQYYDRYVGI